MLNSFSSNPFFHLSQSALAYGFKGSVGIPHPDVHPIVGSAVDEELATHEVVSVFWQLCGIKAICKDQASQFLFVVVRQAAAHFDIAVFHLAEEIAYNALWTGIERGVDLVDGMRGEADIVDGFTA